MDAKKNISVEQLHELVKTIYTQGEVKVKQAYSDFDSSTREFPDAVSLIDDMVYEPGKKEAFFYYSLYYPEAGGYVFEKRIVLKPGSCNDHKFRFSQEGWAWIFLQCNFRNYPKVECRITVNSETRAQKWYGTYPDFKDPSLWNWSVIKKKAGRLTRLLRKFGDES